MTTPVKKYQNVSFKELISFSENNPNRDRQLDSIEILPSKSTQDTSLDNMGLKGYKAYTLAPTGVLSLLACIEDPDAYTYSLNNIRTQQNIDIATKLQERIDELKNSYLARKRKKIYDLIGSTYNGTQLEDKEYLELFAGISFLTNNNFILMKSSAQQNIEDASCDSSLKGEVIFSSNPENWKLDSEVWIVDYHARWVAIPTEKHSQNIKSILAVYLSNLESSGWIVQWPEVDATKTEIVEQLSQLPTWTITDKKLSKEILAIRLGRANCIKLFTEWMTENNNIL